ncbi:N-acetyltransferase [candidate division KSB1 bacterium]
MDDAIFRRAIIHDVPAMVDLINYYAQKGDMLPRSRSAIYEQLRDFVVTEKDGRVAATGALHVVWETLGEIRSVSVLADYAGQGYGKRLVELLLDEAIFLGLSRVFILTYKPDFFAKVGFKLIEKDSLPHKVWRVCLDCPKFPDCDEIAMAIDLK